MKKLLTVFSLLLAVGTATAQHQHNNNYNNNYGHNRGYDRSSWVAPLIIGGVVTYALTRPVIAQPVIVEVPTQQSPDVMYMNGMMYRRELMLINGVYQQVWIRR